MTSGQWERVASPGGPTGNEPPSESLALEDIAVTLDGREVLHGVSLALGHGELVGVIGPPESGKSVLLKAIAHLCPVSHGKVYFHGEPIAAQDPEAVRTWRSRIGMAFQNDALFDSLCVTDNVAFPLRRRGLAEEQIHLRVQACLAAVALAEAGGKLPNELSGGMRKRVGIARAVITEPELGLFDDPISGLDPVTAAKILALIADLSRTLRCTTVVVSNDLPILLPILDRVVMLLDGGVVYDGVVADLLRSPRPEVVQFVTGANEGPL